MRPLPSLLMISACLLVSCASDGTEDTDLDDAAFDAATEPAESTTRTEPVRPAPVTTGADIATTTTNTDNQPTRTDPPTTNATAGPDAYRELNEAEAERFRSTPPEEDGPFFMINFIRYRDEAEYPDGRDSDLTGFEADAIYSEYMETVKFPEIGASRRFVSLVEQDTIGDSDFDVVAVIEYPSRAAWSSMEESEDYREMVIHKEAGVEETLVLAASRRELPPLPSANDAPFPATEQDRPFAFVHVFDYRDTADYEPGDADADGDRSGEEAVGLYSTNAGEVAFPLGVRPLAFFDVEATLVGPADTWEEVRINLFPSHRTLDELTADPVWQSGYHHRDAGLDQTYAIQTLPMFDQLGTE